MAPPAEPLRAALAALPARFRAAVRWLALFEDGVFDQTLGIVLDLASEERMTFVRALLDAGLVTREVAWLRFRPGLAALLAEELERETTPEERAEHWERAVSAYVELAQFLNELQAAGQPEAAGFLAVRELPNLRRAVDHLLETADDDPSRIEQAAGVARDLQSLRDAVIGRTPAQALADDIVAALGRGDADAALAQLEEVAGHPEAPAWLRRIAPAFGAVLRGEKDAARAWLALLPAEDAAALAQLLETQGSEEA